MSRKLAGSLLSFLPLLFSAPARAVPIEVSFHGAPFASWTVAYPDSRGNVVMLPVEDIDGDGTGAVVLALDPHDPVAGMPMMDDVITLAVTGQTRSSILEIPFLHATANDDPVLARWGFNPNGFGGFMLGETFSIQDGQLAGHVAVVSLATALSLPDLFAIDLDSLPRFTGTATVVGIMRLRPVPEPSATLLLAVAAGLVLTTSRRRRRRA